MINPNLLNETEELLIAKRELAFQYKEKEKRDGELIIANEELAFQNKEKEKRAAELIVANKELAFQNTEKKKRAAELVIANKELAFQNKEKENRASELIISTLVDITERKKNEEYIGHLAAIVESSDDAIISKSLDGIIKSWNNGSEKMFGYTAKEAIGNHISLIIPSEYIYEEKQIIERIRNNETIDHYETVRIKKSGARFYVSLTVSPLKDRAGNIIGVSKIARDITSLKESEKKLIQANEYLVFQNEEKGKRAKELIIANKNLLFKKSGEKAKHISNDVTLTKVRRKISIRQKLLLLSFIVLVGNAFIGFAIYKSKQKMLYSEQWVQKAQEVIYQSGNILSLGKDIETSARGFVISNDSAFLVPLYVAQKMTFAYIGKLRKLTEDNPVQQQRVDSLNFFMHKRLDFSLRVIDLRSKHGLLPATDLISSKQGNYYTDRMRQITTAIQQEESILLKQQKQANDRSAATFNLFSWMMLIQLAVFIILLLIAFGNYLLQNKEKEKRASELFIANIELVFQNGEKEKRAAELVIANKELVFQNKEKEKRATDLIILSDDLKAQHEQLKKANDEIVTLNQNLEKRVFERTSELEKLNHKLKELNLSKDKFLSVISHDLRNPLGALLISSEVLSRKTETHFFGEIQPLVKIIDSTSRKIIQQLNELLDWAKMQQEKTTLNAEKLLLISKVEESLELLKDIAAQKNIVIENKVPDDIYVNADYIMLRSILQNLVTNAIKYTPQKGLITVDAQRIDNMVEVCITDSGMGMDADIMKNLFTNFNYASVCGTNNEKGKGLGLILVKDFVNQHGGVIRVKSELGKGTSIIFTMPQY